MRINRPKPDQQVGRDSPWVSHAAIGGKPPPTSNALQVEYLADETRSNVGEGLPPPTSNALQVEYLADETRSNVGGGLPPPTSNALQVEYLADETRSNVGEGLPPPTSNALQVEYLADETRSDVGGACPLPPRMRCRLNTWLTKPDQMWEGACPRWGLLSRYLCCRPTAFGGASSYLIGIQVEAPETAQSAITTIATRRFSVRPAAVSFDATGWLLPKPRSWMFSSFIPTLVSTVATLLARRRESCSL